MEKITTIEMAHDMNSRTIEFECHCKNGKWKTVFGDIIKIGNRQKNETRIKNCMKELESFGAPLGVVCYFIHFCDQAFERQKHWDNA